MIKGKAEKKWPVDRWLIKMKRFFGGYESGVLCCLGRHRHSRHILIIIGCYVNLFIHQTLCRKEKYE